MDGSLRHYGGALPKHLATAILALIERLRPGDGLCHGDLHPDNVIMTAEGPKLIDWICTVSAPAAFELARIHVGLSELAPELVDNPERPRAVNAATQSEYARLAGMSPAALAAAIEPYLPITRVIVVLAGHFACPAGAADPARRSGPALGGLSRARAGVVCPSDSSMSAMGVRRDKAALSSGCEPHPATAPAGSNRSSHGGNEVAEAFD
jgi:Phosphotransferase enzyme family